MSSTTIPTIEVGKEYYDTKYGRRVTVTHKTRTHVYATEEPDGVATHLVYHMHDWANLKEINDTTWQ